MAQIDHYRTPLLAAQDRHSSHSSCRASDRSAAYFANGKLNDGEPRVVLDIRQGEDCEASLDEHKEPEVEEIQEVSGSAVSYERESWKGQSHRLYSFLGDRPQLGPMPSIDPFRNQTPEIGSLYEWLKVLLFLPLAIVRLTLAISTGLIGFVIAKVFLLGWSESELPMLKWRRRLLYTTRIFARLLLFCFGYHWIRRLGKRSKREVAPIVVSNHVSYIDPIFYFFELFPTFVSSASHSDIPGLGMIIRPMQVINVDRHSTGSKKNAAKEIKARALCNDFPLVMLFPEGTTTNGKSLIFFQLGAFMPGLPVQPVVLRYPHVHFDNSWGKASILKLLYRMLTQFHNFMEVEYLPVVYPSPREKSHPSLFARKVKSIMAKALNAVETNHSYGDLILSTKASELKLSAASSYMVEMAVMEKVFHVSTHESMEFLGKFSAMDTSHSGHVTEDQFLGVLELPKNAFSKQIFSFFDENGEGSITFREFLAGSAFILKHPSFGGFIRTAFDFCDFDKRGFLSSLEVKRTLQIVFPEITDSQVQKMVNKLDMDGDGFVSLDDFEVFMEKYPELLCAFLPPPYSE